MEENNITLIKKFSGRSEFIDSFISKTIDGLKEEIVYLTKSLRKHSKYHTWEYGEIALLNLLVNGLVRNDKGYRYLSLQEYGIVDKKDYSQGRADLLIQDMSERVVFLIEAKYGKSPSSSAKKWPKFDHESFYDKIFSQCSNYYEHEKEHVKADSVYLIALVFESTNFHTPQEDIELWKNYDPASLGKEDFYAFLHTEKKDKGLAVYGKYEKVK